MIYNEIIEQLKIQNSDELNALFGKADAERSRHCGNGIFLRGIVEFSSFCDNTCAYCGLNKNNKTLKRYRLTEEQILDAVKNINTAGINSVVLQSGEEHGTDPGLLTRTITRIKNELPDMAITLSAGEKEDDVYKEWFEAGADRYLLKIETTDEALYGRLHPGMDLKNRLRCSESLKRIGYQNGSGLLIGLPGLTEEIIARDILYLQQMDFDMVGIGLFIPHRATELSDIPHGNLQLTLKTIALTRLALKNSHLPATTAIGSIEEDYRVDALRAGANVIMPNFTPLPYRELYEIYPGKKCAKEDWNSYFAGLNSLAGSIGRYIDKGRGDSLKNREQYDSAQRN